MLTDIITGIIGIVMICVFLGFMLVWVKALPLIVIVVGTMGLLIHDFVRSVRENASGA